MCLKSSSLLIGDTTAIYTVQQKRGHLKNWVEFITFLTQSKKNSLSIISGINVWITKLTNNLSSIINITKAGFQGFHVSSKAVLMRFTFEFCTSEFIRKAVPKHSTPAGKTSLQIIGAGLWKSQLILRIF